MNNVNKSVLRVNKFFKQLENFNSYNIIIHTDKKNALIQSKISDNRNNKISFIDGELFIVKPNIKVATFPYNGGIKEYKYIISLTDDPLISIIKNNGGIIVGSSNMDEAAFGGDTSSSFYGRCINPLNKQLSVGGSSGGSAAAISSGIVNYSIGTDTMGSVRIPASYCGVIGYKPSSSILSNKDLLLLSHTYDTIGFMSNNMININKLYDLINIKNKIKSYKNIADNNKIRCIIPSQVIEEKINEDVLKNFYYVISKLKKFNVNIEIKSLDNWQPNNHRKALLKLVENEGAKNLKDLLNDKKSKITDNLRNNLSFGESITRDKIYNYQKELEKLKKTVGRIFDDFDLIIMPTTPQNSFYIRSKPPENQANFTSLANIADLPSICLPFFNNSKKPSSLQMIASNLNDNFLIKTSSYFEKILQ